MRQVTASELRQDVYRLLDEVLDSGEPLEIGRLTDPAAAVVASLASGAGVQVATAPFAACVDAALGSTWTRDLFDRLIVREHHADSFWG